MNIPVLLPKVFNYPLTYKSENKAIKSGDLVEVPFGKETTIGVVWDKIHVTSKNIKIRPIGKCKAPRWMSTFQLLLNSG